MDAEWVTAAPTAVLCPFVEGYVGYRMGGTEPGVHRGLPSRHMTLIVSIGPGIDVTARVAGGPVLASFGAVLGGLQDGPVLITHGGHQEGVAVQLSPLGSRALLGLPAAALCNLSVELDEVAGSAGGELWERLQGPAPWAVRFATCDTVLGRLVRADAVVAPQLTVAWRALARSGGSASIGEVARQVGWSRQHLARRFGDEFGLPPKRASRVLRFDRATQLLRAPSGTGTVAAVAAACGYFDQSHLDRDFAELAGCAPTAWLASEVPSVQDGPPATLGSSSS